MAKQEMLHELDYSTLPRPRPSFGFSAIFTAILWLIWVAAIRLEVARVRHSFLMPIWWDALRDLAWLPLTIATIFALLAICQSTLTRIQGVIALTVNSIAAGWLFLVPLTFD
jgi:hypothetical protein